MRPLATIVLLAAAFFFSSVSLQAALTLREQLNLAEKDEDTHAQIELIRRILDQEPGDAGLREELATLWLAVADYNMAEKTILDWKDAPPAVRARVLAEVLYRRDDKKDEAAALLEKYLASQPGDLEITRQLAEYLMAMGEYPRVVTLLDAAPGVSHDADLLVTRAKARRQGMDFAGALRDFAEAEDAGGDEAVVVNNRPDFERLKSALEPINSATEVLTQKPGDFGALLTRSWWYLYTGFATEQALADAEAARKANPKSVGALLLYATAANRANKLTTREAQEKWNVDLAKALPEAKVLSDLATCDAQLAKTPDDASQLATRAFVLNDAPQQYALALLDAEAALALDPNSFKAHLEKIYALVKLGRLEPATAGLNALEATKPPTDKLATAYSYLVDAAFTNSQFPIALDYANRAIKLKPAAHYYKQRAAILQRMNRAAEAEADVEKAKQLEKGKKS